MSNRAWRRYLRFWGSDPERDLDDELRFHIAARVDEYVAMGLTPEAAHAEAAKRFGDMTRFRDQCAEIDSQWRRQRTMLETLHGFATDLARAVRSLRRTPTLTAAAVLCFGLGIGVNVSIFSVVNAVLFRPLPFREPDRLVLVGEKLPRFSDENFGVISLGEYSDYRGLNGRDFESSAIYETRAFALAERGEAERVAGIEATPELFSVLGVAFAHGRGFVARDTMVENGTSVVISDELWHRRFREDASVIGRSIDLDGKPATIIGIAPPGFQFPLGGQLGVPADVFMAFHLPANVDKQRANSFNTYFIARLAPGVTLAAGRHAVDAFAQTIPRRHPEMYGPGWLMNADLVPIRDRAVHKVRQPLLILLAAVGVVLLIACINVSSLLIARAASRQRETAVRQALGASRARLVQQSLAEAVVLVLSSGAIGLVLAVWGARFLAVHAPHNVLEHYTPRLDARVLVWSTAVLAATAFIFALVPAFSSSAGGLGTMLRDEARGGTAGRAQRGGRRSLVIVEMALAVMLAATGGLMVRSFLRARDAAPGFETAHAVTVRVPLPAARYPGATEILDFQRRLVERFHQIAGVTAASATNDLPMGDDQMKFAVAVEASTSPTVPIVGGEIVSPGYFDAMRIPLREGRGLDARDGAGAPGAVVVNETLARKYFGGRTALGQRVKSGGRNAPTPWMTIVGVAADVREEGLDKPVEPQVYFSVDQTTPSMVSGILRTASYVVRTEADEHFVIPEIQRAVHELDPGLPLVGLRPLSEVVGSSLSERTFNTVLLGAFAVLAMLLAAVGVYGLLAYSVVQRTREIGIRLAIGATPSSVIGLVVGNGAALALIAVVIGIAGAAALTRVLRSILFDVSPFDMTSLAGAAVVVFGVALLASWIPARRASRIDPQTAMRGE
jgi:putative ABC transport system permease protein